MRIQAEHCVSSVSKSGFWIYSFMNFCYVITFLRLQFFLPSLELVYTWFRQRHIPRSVVACFFNPRFGKCPVFFLLSGVFIFCYVIAELREIFVIIFTFLYCTGPRSAFTPTVEYLPVAVGRSMNNHYKKGLFNACSDCPLSNDVRTGDICPIYRSALSSLQE